MSMEPQKKFKILISNDDGVNAVGLFQLVKSILLDSSLNNEQLDLRVSAPATEQSAKSHSITLREQLVATRHAFRSLTITKDSTQTSEPGPLKMENISAWAVEGTPADACRVGLHGAFETGYKPDLILSGINRGANSGLNAIYSGTIAAAMEGVINGVPAIALSLNHPDTYPEGEWFWESAGSHAVRVIKPYIEQLRSADPEQWKAGWLVNITLPNCPVADVKGVKLCKQGDGKWTEKFQMVKQEVSENLPERRVFSVGGTMCHLDTTEEKDCYAVRQNYVTITTLNLKQGEVIEPFFQNVFKTLL